MCLFHSPKTRTTHETPLQEDTDTCSLLTLKDMKQSKTAPQKIDTNLIKKYLKYIKKNMYTSSPKSLKQNQTSGAKKK